MNPVYDYSFRAMPDLRSPIMLKTSEVFDLFRLINPRGVITRTEQEFDEFREGLRKVGITLCEIARVPHHEPEDVP